MAAAKKKKNPPAAKKAAKAKPSKPAARPKAKATKPVKAVKKAASKPAKKGAAPKRAVKAPSRKSAKATPKRVAPKRAPAHSAAPSRAPAPVRAAPAAPAAISGARTIPPKAPPTAPGQPDLKVGDAAVQKATGKNWAQWCEVLDAAGARSMAHSDIARLVFERFRIGPWWAQMVTVGYEQARGTREKHQKADGYSVSATKTIAAPVERVYAAWNQDAERSRWLGINLKVRSATPPKSIRLNWSDQVSQVVVMLYARGTKTQVAVEHNKLKDQEECTRMKAYWGAALERLAAALKGT